MALLSTLTLVAGPLVAPTPAAAATIPELTFGGLVRSTGHRAIFVGNADGTGVRSITPNDGREYEWGRFAFGNTKIVYTVHSAAPGSPEDLALMDIDGSNPRVLRRFEYDIMQPVVDKAGTFVYYAAKTSFFSRVAHFRLDLRTNLVTNLTAVGSPTTGQDVDPNLTATGKSVLFVRNPTGRGAEIALMNTDGTDRRAITSLAYHNTDPSPSPDGRRFVTASYRGYGKPSQANPTAPSNTGLPGVLPARRAGPAPGRAADRSHRRRELHHPQPARRVQRAGDVRLRAPLHAGRETASPSPELGTTAAPACA